MNIYTQHPGIEVSVMNPQYAYEKKIKESIIEYTGDKDYSYLDIKYFHNIDEIPDIIESGDKKEKWYNEARYYIDTQNTYMLVEKMLRIIYKEEAV